MNTEQIRISKSFFDELGIETPEDLDAYKYGNHGLRYYLWACLGYIELPSRSTEEYLRGKTYEPISNIFRHLDEGDLQTFENELISFKIKLVKKPQVK